ncbi:MAG: adenylate/guanylate cyclase domain-containing protein [Nitrosomonas sp.]|nr:adenylate/guanylate cyclase domain-containing protein [Nitrosomonas sp.]
MTKHFKRILLGICVGLFAIAVYLTPQGQLLEEEYGLYWLFQLRGTTPAPDEVIVVAADRPSAIQMGLPVNPRFWPWPRDYHARLIEQLAQAGAAIIVLDLVFDSPGPEPEHDRALAEAIEKAGNVILVERLSAAPPENADAFQLQIIQHRRIAPLPEIAAATLSHVPFPLPRIPRINAYWAFKADTGDFPTMPIVALQAFSLGVYDDFIALLQEIENFDIADLPTHKEQITDLESLILNLREKFVNHPGIKQQLLSELRKNKGLDNHTKYYIHVLANLYSNQPYHYLNFYGPPRTIHTVPYHQILLPNDTGANAYQSILGTIKGKAVFVGLSAATQSEQDIVRDSYHTVFTESEGRQIDGVEIAATAFANLLENKPISPFPHEGSLGLLFIMGLTLGFIFPLLSNRKLLIISFFLAGGYTFFAWLIFKQANIWLPLITPLLIVIPGSVFGATVLKYLIARHERDQLLELFGQFTPERVVGDFSRQVDSVLHKDQLVFGALLFTDIKGYTTLAEEMDVRQLRLLMDDYFNVLSQSVRQNNGSVSEKIGDAMLAIWESTSASKALRKHACEAGLSIVNNVNKFNKDSRHHKLPTRIGIHFGKLLVSKLGSMDNYIYRVVGDLVSTTSRIEGTNKFLGTNLLVTNELMDGIDCFLTRPVGSFRFAGKSLPVNLSELITYRQKASESQLLLCEMFTDALNAYLLQQHSAIQKWTHILKQFPGDGPTKFYLNVCTQSPPNQWKPVIEFTEK